MAITGPQDLAQSSSNSHSCSKHLPWDVLIGWRASISSLGTIPCFTQPATKIAECLLSGTKHFSTAKMKTLVVSCSNAFALFQEERPSSEFSLCSSCSFFRHRAEFIVHCSFSSCISFISSISIQQLVCLSFSQPSCSFAATQPQSKPRVPPHSPASISDRASIHL